MLPAVRRLLIALASVCGALLAAELSLRLWRPESYLAPQRPIAQEGDVWGGLVHRPSDTPGLDYELVPGFEGSARGVQVSVNALGMRDREPLPADTPGLVRVAVVGDSVTYGYGVEQDAPFAQQLEDALAATPAAAAGSTFDVLNFGVSGYSTRDEVVVLRERVLAFDPELVILAYVLNDPEFEPSQPLQAYFHEPAWWQHSQVLRTAARKLRDRAIRDLGGGDYFRYLHHPDGRKWKSVLRGFDEMRDLCAERGIPVLVVVFPNLAAPTWEDYRYGDLHDQIVAAARERGFQGLDLLPAFSTVPVADLAVGGDDYHPNAVGHGIAAREIQRALARHWMPDAGAAER